jgi:hypothetical protein
MWSTKHLSFVQHYIVVKSAGLQGNCKQKHSTLPSVDVNIHVNQTLENCHYFQLLRSRVPGDIKYVLMWQHSCLLM